MQQIPPELSLVYWDYYHKDQSTYETLVEKHLHLNRPTIMASGVWTWSRFWCAYQHSLDTMSPCIKACQKNNISEIFATLWGDDGAEVCLDSALPGLIAFSRKCFSITDEKCYQGDFATLFNGNWNLFLLGDAFDSYEVPPSLSSAPNLSKMLLWQDPWLGHLEAGRLNNHMGMHYGQLLEKIKAIKREGELNTQVNFLLYLAEILVVKADLPLQFKNAIQGNDQKQLFELQIIIENLKSKVKTLHDFHRELWHQQMKPQGFEVLDVRYAGIIARLQTGAFRIKEFIAGRDDMKDVLEDALPWRDGWFTTATYRRSFSTSVQISGFNY